MKLLKILSLCVLPLCALISSSAYAADSDQKSVSFAAIIEHPALEKVKAGVLDELKENGYEEGKNLTVRYQSAQGNMANAIQIAKQFSADRPDVIVGLGTPTAQAVANSTKTIPVIFTAVTDPVSAKLTKSWAPTGTNVTGVSDQLSIEKQIEVIKMVKPDAKKVGFIYNPGEVNSTIVLKELQTLLPAQGMELVPVAAQRTSDIPTAALSLQGKVDVIYSNTDNNVISAYESLVKIGNQYKIPLIASEPDSVGRGASAGLGMSYYDLGRQAGRQIIRIFNGEKPGDIAPEVGDKTKLAINKKAAEAQGLTLNDDLLNAASIIIE